MIQLPGGEYGRKKVGGPLREGVCHLQAPPQVGGCLGGTKCMGDDLFHSVQRGAGDQAPEEEDGGG